MFKKTYVMDFHSQARTLSAEQVFGPGHNWETGSHSFTHPDGWTISGVIVEDYCYWVNIFEASHPVHGRVWGNFEEEVCADSEEGFTAFLADHPYEEWDYYDI